MDTNDIQDTVDTDVNASLSDRELLEKIARQNDQMISLLSQGVGALQEFQSGGMGKMIAGMFGRQ